MATSQTHQGEDDQLKTQNRSIISTLPSTKGWFSDDDIKLRRYQGFWYSDHVLEGLLNDVHDSSRWNLHSSNILLCSSPKCGATWLKALAFTIVTRNRFHDPFENNPLCTTISHELVPFVEFYKDSTARDPNLPLLSTHVPYTCLPSSVFEYGSKIVYVWRDPKDVFVSLLHFAHKLSSSAQLIPLDQAFDLFCRGISSFGPYWDHVQGYWRGSLDHPENVLFLKYEDMMGDPLSNVIMLAEFMRYPFSKEEEADGVPTKIVNLCSFKSMSNMKGASADSKIPHMSGLTNSVTNNIFFRKGKVGDWRNYLTTRMAEKIDKITREKLGPLGLKT